MWKRFLFLALLCAPATLCHSAFGIRHSSFPDMSLFSGVETEAPERKPYNVDAVETSSQQQNIVVPYFAGVHPCPVDWVDDLINLTSRDVHPGGSGKGGKGGSGGASAQKEWRANIAGTTNICPDDAPNDAILHILVNGEPVLGGEDPLNPIALSRAPGQHYVAFSIPKFSAACRFYWGTKDQPIDDLVLGPAPNLHSAYRNRGLFVAQQWFLGATPNVQTIVFVLARGTKFFGGARFEAGSAGVNPMGPAYELYTDPLCGAGLPETRLVQSSFEDTAAAMTAESMFIAPHYHDARPGRTLLLGYGQYFDGWFRRSGDKIEAGYFSHGPIDVDALPELGSDAIIGEPKIRPGTLKDTQNAFWTNYSNRAKWYKPDDTERYIDQANLDERNGLKVDARLERPFIIDGAIAVRHNIGFGKIHALKPGAGTIIAIRDRAPYRPGQRFKTNIDSLSLSFVWRITGRDLSSDRSGAYKFTVENERGIYPTHFVPDPAPVPPWFVIIPSAIENVRIIEVRSGLKTALAIQVAVLAQRPSTHIIGMRVHVSLDGGTYTIAYVQQHFAAYGQVAVAYPNSTSDLDTTVGVIIDLSGEDKNIVASQTVAERDDNRLLLFINNEIFSVGTVTALGGDQVKVFPRRKLYGTVKGSHAVDSECFFIYRAALEPIAHSSFAAGATRQFKLQPFTLGSDVDLDEVDPIPYTFHTSSPIAAPFNLALTSHAYVDSQGVRHSVILAAWDYVADQDVVLFGVAYRPTSSIALLPNEEQGLSFPLLALGAGVGETVVQLGATGTDEPAQLVRILNEEQAAWFDVISTGAAGEEVPAIIPAADPAPGHVQRLFNPQQNLWFELLCLGAASEEVLALSEGEEGLSLGHHFLGVDSLAVPSTPWIYIAIDVPDLEIRVTAGVMYEVMVRNINSFGEPSDYCTPESIIAGVIDLFQIVNLRIAGQAADDHVLRSVDCHLVWDLYSPAQGITIQGGPDGTTRGPFDPGLVDFEIKIYQGNVTLEEIEAGTATRVWRDISNILNYDFSLEKNIASLGGPYDIFTAWVGGWDPANRAAAPQVFYVTKEAPPIGSNVLMVPALGAMDLSWTNPDALGIDYVRIDVGGLASGNIRRIPFPGTYHHVIPLAPGSSYKFLLRWYDKFGVASAILETGWSPLVLGGGPGGGADLAPVTFDPDGGALDNTTPVTLAHPTAPIYWRRDATTPTTADNLYSGPIDVDPPGSEDPFDITARAHLDGVYGPAVTRNFLPYTPGGGAPPDRPSAPYFTPPAGTYYTDPLDYLDTVLSSDNTGTFDIYYVIAVGQFGFPLDPTHDGAGNPTGDTERIGGPSGLIRIDDPTGGYCRISALVFKPGAAIPDSVITRALFRIHHT